MASAQFESAVAAVRLLEDDPGKDVKLRLYALYKQATQGDASGGRPGLLDPVGRVKYDAWAKLSGTSTDEAEAQYVAIARDFSGT